MSRFLRAAVEAPTWLAALFVLLMALHMAADVVAKYVFNVPIDGTTEIVSFYYMIGIVFLPIGRVETREQQIAVDILYDFMGPRIRRAMRAFASLLGLAFFVILLIQTSKDALRAFSVGELAMGEAAIAIWPARVMLPLGFACGALAILLRLFREFRPAKDGQHA